MQAWCDPEVAAVLCARGGSGIARIVDRLDWAAMAGAGPKVLVGFSDVTVLHEAVAHHLGLATLFGPMPAASVFGGENPEPVTAEHLRRTLFEPETARVLEGDASVCHVPGRARGVTVGGTLALLANTVGTAESRPARGGIAILEDVAEPAYRLDSMLTQLLRTGWFDGVAGVVLGSWLDCGDGAVETVVERLEGLGVPLMSGLPFGHGVPQLTVPLGVEAEVDTTAADTDHVPAGVALRPPVQIRPFRPGDADAVYDVCLRTGERGGDATGLVDRDLIGDVWAGPYLAYAPELAFVAEDPAGRVVGYVLGVRDTRGFEAA